MHTKTLKKLALLLTFWVALRFAPLHAQVISGNTVDGDLTVTGNSDIEGDTLSLGGFSAITMETGSSFGGEFTGPAMGLMGGSASGAYSFAAGNGTEASGARSMALGYNALATGTMGSTVLGFDSTASGSYSTALGCYTTASGEGSMAFGCYTTASAYYSTATGLHTTAPAFDSFVVGTFNVGKSKSGGTSNASSWYATDPLFEIGNGTGTGTSAADALVVYKNGDTTINGMDNEMPHQTLVGAVNSANSVLTKGIADGLYLHTSGDVGIGTATPAFPLDVNGTVGNSAGNFVISSANDENTLSVGNSAPFSLMVPNSGTTTIMQFGNSAGGAGDIMKFLYNASSGALTWNLQNNSYYNRPLSIYNTAGLMIGSSSPAVSMLDIDGSMSVGSYAGASAAPTNGLIVSGNVGIGTSSPGYPLVVNSGSAGFTFDPANQVIGTSIGTGGNLTLCVTNAGGGSITGAGIFIGGSTRGDAQKNAIQFLDNSTEYMRVDGNASGHTAGNVGIGTTTPVTKLEVNGNAQVDGTLRCVAGGDLTMGSFTAGTAP